MTGNGEHMYFVSDTPGYFYGGQDAGRYDFISVPCRKARLPPSEPGNSSM